MSQVGGPGDLALDHGGCSHVETRAWTPLPPHPHPHPQQQPISCGLSPGRQPGQDLLFLQSVDEARSGLFLRSVSLGGWLCPVPSLFFLCSSLLSLALSRREEPVTSFFLSLPPPSLLCPPLHSCFSPCSSLLRFCSAPSFCQFGVSPWGSFPFFCPLCPKGACPDDLASARILRNL